MKVKLDKGAFMPLRAHESDAGYDLKTPIDFYLKPESDFVIDTGVHVQIPKGYVGILKSKSGLNVKRSVIGTGTIDSGYTGSIVVKLYNLGDNYQHFRAGDKIIQLVIYPIFTEDLEQVEELEETERGDKGFGSTGR